MSYIYGVLNKTADKPEPLPAQLQRTADAVSDIPRDKSGQWCNEYVGLGHLLRVTTPESLHEQLPYCDSASGISITADARIDNREQLLTQFPTLAAHCPDSLLIIAAYKHWGANCAYYLRGDFSFALWDETQQQLLLCRDIMGIKPLYYYTCQRRVAFASSILGLLFEPNCDYSINKKWLANYFISIPLLNNYTAYEQILTVPPASYVLIRDDRIETHTYFNFDENKEIHLASAAEYAEVLHQKFVQAVTRRVRSHYPAGAELSGGLDSSSIVITASNVLNKGDKHRANRLHTFSNVMTKEQAQQGGKDEQEYIDIVNNAANTQPHGVSIKSGLFDLLTLTLERFGQPATLGHMAVYFQPTFVAVQKTGVRTLLSGYGGDEVVTAQAGRIVHTFLRKGQWLRYFQFVVKQAKARQQPTIKYTLTTLKRSIGLILFSHASAQKQAVASVAGKQRINRYLKPSYTQNNPLFKAAINTQATLYQNKSVRQEQIKILKKIPYFYRIDTAAIQCLYYGIDYSYPMLDRDLLEFMLAVPDEHKASPEWGRILFRLAMQHDVPAEITWRNNKFFSIVPSARASITNVLPVLQKFLADTKYNALVTQYFNMPLLQQNHRHGEYLINAVYRAAMLKTWTKFMDTSGINKPD